MVVADGRYKGEFLIGIVGTSEGTKIIPDALIVLFRYKKTKITLKENT